MPNHPDELFNQKFYGTCPQCGACISCTIDNLGELIECHRCKHKILISPTINFAPGTEDLEQSYNQKT